MILSFGCDFMWEINYGVGCIILFIFFGNKYYVLNFVIVDCFLQFLRNEVLGRVNILDLMSFEVFIIGFWMKIDDKLNKGILFSYGIFE